MDFLSPGYLALGTLAIPIILLYMLKLRRREVEISSTMLWQLLLRDRQANTPWQRLKRNLLLILQLLILAGLVIALARPYILTPSITEGSIVLLLDASASMRATDVKPNRFVVAKEAAHNLVNDLPSNSLMTIILVEDHPNIRISKESNKNKLHQIIESTQPSQGPVDWSAAFSLVSGVISSSNASIGPNDLSDSTIVIITDGGLSDKNLPSLPGKLKYIPIGSTADNIAISALAVRPTSTGTELFTRIDNYSDIDRIALLSVWMDNQLLQEQRLDIPARMGISYIVSDLPPNHAIYEVRLSNIQSVQPLDSFSLDNIAYTVYTPPSVGRTLLISEGNIFLEQMLASLPNLTPFRVVPDSEGNLTLPRDPFELYIFDGFLPEELPEGNLLLINPPPNDLFSVQGTTDQIENPVITKHAITQFVDWHNIHILEAKLIEPPSWAETLINSQETPLLFLGELDGRRTAVLSFDLHNSDLPLHVAFPILFSNLANYLIPSGAFDQATNLKPGEALEIRPEVGVIDIAVISPSEQTHDLVLNEQGAIFSSTNELGLYEVKFSTEETQFSEYFSVNLFLIEESDIRPTPNIQLGQTNITQSISNDLGQREIWKWLSSAALGILLIEWWVYHRRQYGMGKKIN